MRRKEWTVDFPAGDVREAAGAKAAHHAQREKHYADVVERVVGEIKERGIIIEERPDPRFGVSTYYEPHGRIDPELDKQLGDAQSKLSHHRSHRAEFERWVGMLSQGCAPDSLPLDIDDVEFFGL